MIELVDARKHYRKKGLSIPALDGISLSVSCHTWLAIIGPSGSGKSTLLNIIGLLDRPTSGDFHFNGRNTRHLDDRECSKLRNQHLGFIFQSFNLIPQYSALKNVALTLRYAGIKKKKRRRIAQDLLERVGLQDRIDHLPSELSGGEEQRVAVARALANSPSLILADEPTGNLDQQAGLGVMHLIKEFHELGVGVVFVTHDEAATKLAQECIRIVDGRIDTTLHQNSR